MSDKNPKFLKQKRKRVSIKNKIKESDDIENSKKKTTKKAKTPTVVIPSIVTIILINKRPFKSANKLLNIIDAFISKYDPLSILRGFSKQIAPYHDSILTQSRIKVKS
jgi:hypothetical protein